MGRTSKYTPISLLELLTLSAGRFGSSHKANAPLCPQGSKIELVMFSTVTTPSSQSQKRYRQTYGYIPGCTQLPRDLKHVIYRAT